MEDSSTKRVDDVRDAHAASVESRMYASAAGPAVATAADAAVVESLAIDPRRQRSARIKMVLLFVLFSLPVVASYLTYYVFMPGARTNYGALIEPQIDLPDLPMTGPDGTPLKLSSLRGRWVMLAVDDAACDAACERKLWMIRQVRLTTGKDRDRVERLWVATGDATPRAALMAEHAGLLVARPRDVRAAELEAVLPPDRAAGGTLRDHVWVVDPLGHVMMRFPRDADPNRVKKDIAKLLRVSRIG